MYKNTINNSQNVLGFSELLSTKNGMNSSNLENIENEIIQGSKELNKKKNNGNDVLSKYDEEIKRLTNELNIDDDDDVLSIKSYNSEHLNDIISDDDTISEYSNKEYNNNNTRNLSNNLTGNMRNMGNMRNNIRIEDKNLNRLTNEEKKQKHINNVMNNITGNKVNNLDYFNIQKEKEIEDKITLIEQIDQLKSILEDECIDISRVPKASINDDYKTIKNIYKILKLKNDRNRLSSLADESILLLAAGIEYVFDGEKEYFGLKPNLIGWSDTLRIKLRRLRFETSSVISSIVQDYRISPGMRLFLEIVPSMVLYSRAKNLAKTDNSSKYKTAINELNEL
tara:strand:- start:3065 stop:4081 length:1017 start_codon:yes stop_codon:yes gene_type:complete